MNKRILKVFLDEAESNLENMEVKDLIKLIKFLNKQLKEAL